MDQFINPIERSLLNDLIGLYSCDLTREQHHSDYAQCIACAKAAIILAIVRYCVLDAKARNHN